MLLFSWCDVKFSVKLWFVNFAPTSNVAQHDRSRWKNADCSCEIDFLGVRLEILGAAFPQHKLDKREFRTCIIHGLRDKGTRSVWKTGRDVCISVNIREKGKVADTSDGHLILFWLSYIYLLSGTAVEIDHFWHCVWKERIMDVS